MGLELKAHATGVCSQLLFIPEFPEEPFFLGYRLDGSILNVAKCAGTDGPS